MIDIKNYDVGVIVGRFQIPELHDGHIDLIETVAKNHDKVLIVLGLSQTVNTVNNPLDFEARRHMITDSYPEISVLYIKDVNSDDMWSQNLDRIVGDFITPTQSVLLYGSRDSFIEAYTGKYPTYELLQENYESGTEIRNKVRKTSVRSKDFRAGVIWAASNRFPVVYTCVDVAIFSPDFKRIGLARKPHQDKWQLVGGFADVNSDSFEDDAHREVREETGIGFHAPMTYLGSFKIDEWRYRKEPDTIKTLLFRNVTEEIGKAKDDIEEFKWFDTAFVSEKLHTMIALEHQPLVRKAIESVR